jgi:hypothetical protein
VSTVEQCKTACEVLDAQPNQVCKGIEFRKDKDVKCKLMKNTAPFDHTTNDTCGMCSSCVFTQAPSPPAIDNNAANSESSAIESSSGAIGAGVAVAVAVAVFSAWKSARGKPAPLAPAERDSIPMRSEAAFAEEFFQDLETPAEDIFHDIGAVEAGARKIVSGDHVIEIVI